MPLADPRVYAHRTMKNPLVLAVLDAVDRPGAETQAALQQALHLALLENPPRLLPVAMNLMPSAQAYHTLWSGLQQVLGWGAQAKPWLQLVAMPILLVAGASQPVSLSASLPDWHLLRAMLVDGGVIADTPELWLSPQLYALHDLEDLPWAEIYARGDSGTDVQGIAGLPEAAALQVQPEEKVFLRYVLGWARVGAGALPYATHAINSDWAMRWARHVQTAWAAQGATVWLMPMPVQPWLSAWDQGRMRRHEVVLHLFLSRSLRHWRQQRLEPRVALSAQTEPAALRVDVRSPRAEEADLCDSFVWPVQPQDDWLDIEARVRQILSDAQVSLSPS